MSKVTLFVHTTLDGFAAGPNGEMDCFSVSEELFDYVKERIDAVNTALYGRVTFEMMQSYWPTAADQPDATRHDIEHAAWYKAVRKVVVSNTLRADTTDGLTVIGADLAAEVAQLRQETTGEIVMFGSPTAAHALMAQDLVDGYLLFVNPVLLGAGTPLFKRPHSLEKLRLVGSHVFDVGVVCLEYERTT